ncbi:MAG: hypothetical protein SGJ03_00230 [Alphaproteobacteria bacterium]|nr:hypothetical protein [Alphaproteobacteria bacterium]
MRILLALSSLLLTATAALAAPAFTSPGWYQIADTIYGPVVERGPYADEDACKADLLPNEADANYACEYLTERPSWDD